MKEAFQRALWVVLLAAAFGSGTIGCRPAQKKRVPEKARFGLALEVPAALPIVALQKGYFAAEGL